MDPHTPRSEAERWLGIAEKLLASRDLVGSRSFAIRARESDPTNPTSEQILAVVDTLMAAEKRVINSGHYDWYSILQLSHLVRDPDLIASHYRRLVLLLNPDHNHLPYADFAIRVVFDAWSVLSDPAKKWMYDSELAVFLQRGNDPEPPRVDSSSSSAATYQFFHQPTQQQQQQQQWIQHHQEPVPVQLQEHQLFRNQNQPQQQQRSEWEQHQQHRPSQWLPQHQQPLVQRPTQWLPEQRPPPPSQPLQQEPAQFPPQLQRQQPTEPAQFPSQLQRRQQQQQPKSPPSQLQRQQQQPKSPPPQLQRQQQQPKEPQFPPQLQRQQQQQQPKSPPQLQRQQQQQQPKEPTQFPPQLQRQQPAEPQFPPQLQRQKPAEPQFPPQLQRQQQQHTESQIPPQLHRQQESQIPPQLQRQQPQTQPQQQNKTPTPPPPAPAPAPAQQTTPPHRPLQQTQKESNVRSKEDGMGRGGNVVNEKVTDNGNMRNDSANVVDNGDSYDDGGIAGSFWTACPYCYHLYEYSKAFEECTLRCQNCRRAFQAVQVPNPPGAGDEASFCSWGFFPIGFSMTSWKKSAPSGNGVGANWTPFSPMFACPVQQGAKTKKWTIVDASDDEEDLEVSSDDDSDSSGEWGSNRKKVKRANGRSKRGRPPGRKSNAEREKVANQRSAGVENSQIPRNDVVSNNNTNTAVASGSLKKQTGKGVRGRKKLDLNVEFSNEVEDHAAAARDGNGEEIGFFEGLDEFLSTLPILHVVGDDKAKPS